MLSKSKSIFFMINQAISFEEKDNTGSKLRELSFEEYSYIADLKKSRNYCAIEKLTKKIRAQFYELEHFSDEEIKIMFENAHDAPYNLFLDIRENSVYIK